MVFYFSKFIACRNTKGVQVVWNICGQKTGCLNCFFLLKIDKTLRQINEKANEELSKLDIFDIDLCGNPHTVSFPECMAEFAAKIVAFLAFMQKTKRFAFDYLVECWECQYINSYDFYWIVKC